jgi:TMEM175 potassium channel family protein
VASTPRRIPGTSRVEAFSDGVVAIIVTLLIFEVRLPEVPANPTNADMLAAFGSIWPKFASFAVSFFTVAIYWVNHHNFFAGVTHTDWKLLWANNLLLFFLAIVPFTTAVLGDHLGQPIAVAAYALNLGLAGAAFTLMGWYVLLGARLIDPRISDAARRIEVKRSVIGTSLYLLAVPLGLLVPVAAEVLFVAVPIAFIVPGLFGRIGTELRELS